MEKQMEKLNKNLVVNNFLLRLVTLKRQFVVLSNQGTINSHDRFMFSEKLNELVEFFYDNENSFGCKYDDYLEYLMAIDNLINLEV